MFAAVAKHLNVTKTSQELRVSQSSVSHQLARLQREVGVRPYKKTNGGIELTDAGRIFLSQTTAILLQLDELRGRFPKADEVQAVSLTVGGSHGPSAVILPKLLARFKKCHPTVQLTFRTADRHSIVSLVLRAEVDIALVTGPVSSSSIAKEPYRQEKLVAFVPANHPLGKRRHVTLSDLARSPLVIRTGKGGTSTGAAIVELMESHGFKPNIVLRCESPEAVKESVRRKMGVGILYADTLEPEFKDRKFKSLNVLGVELRGASFIIYHAEKPLSAQAKDFLLLLRDSRQA
ncbi:MAG TPA: LysR family transcriptional regulator [Candidatus Acidoferrales bacterium]|nr:LysR family transcriptional regulator [Candidatus Acidoferrales bacterium]